MKSQHDGAEREGSGKRKKVLTTGFKMRSAMGAPLGDRTHSSTDPEKGIHNLGS